MYKDKKREVLPRFELGLTDSESDVLPLHHRTNYNGLPCELLFLLYSHFRYVKFLFRNSDRLIAASNVR